jgi:hypothetical protein
MPTIANLTNAAIRMFFDDHLPPHFHLVGPDSSAQISLATLDVIQGHASRRDLAEARAWARANMDVLTTNWSEFND